MSQLLVLDPPYARLQPLDGQAPGRGTILVADLRPGGPAAVSAVDGAVTLSNGSVDCQVCCLVDGNAPEPALLAALDRLPNGAAWVVLDGDRGPIDPRLVVMAVQARSDHQ